MTINKATGNNGKLRLGLKETEMKGTPLFVTNSIFFFRICADHFDNYKAYIPDSYYIFVKSKGKNSQK